MDVFEKILASHRQTSLPVPQSLAKPLSDDERDGLALGIRGQRSAARPETTNWHLFWEGPPPFFGHELSFLLLGQVSSNILQCADPVRDPSMLRSWKSLDTGLRFALERLDACRCLFFDANQFLLMDRQRPIEAWRFGPPLGADGARGPLSGWQAICSADVLDVLLLAWESTQAKARFARERLCDIADKALSARK
jgi:hypothetical protein